MRRTIRAALETRPLAAVLLALVALFAAHAHASEAVSPLRHGPSDRAPALAPLKAAERPVEDEADTAPPMRVAVYDLEVEGLSPRTARVVTDSVLFEVRKLTRVSAIGMDEVRAMLDHEAQKQLVGCSAEESCLADIAGALGVDGLVIGALARVGEEHIFTLKRIDQRAAATVATSTKRLPAGDGEELLAVVGEMVATLFEEYPVRAGMERGVSPEVGRRLNPPPLPTWVFWSSVGVTGVLLASAGVTAAGWAVFQGDYRALAERSAAEVVDGPTLKDAGARAQSTELVGWSLLGASAVAGVITGVLSLVTDFGGYGEDE